MKKLVVLVLAGLMVAGMAYGQDDIDDAVNSMGFYFDDGTFIEYQLDSVAMNTVVPCYIVVKNADFGALYGYEFGYSYTGAVFFDLGIAFAGSGPVDVGGEDYNHIVGLNSPLPVDPAGTIVATVSLLFGMEPVLLTLTGAEPNSTIGSRAPALLLANDEIVEAGLSAGFDETGAPNVCASINGVPGEVIAIDEASWDQVKSLYR